MMPNAFLFFHDKAIQKNQIYGTVYLELVNNASRFYWDKLKCVYIIIVRHTCLVASTYFQKVCELRGLKVIQIGR